HFTERPGRWLACKSWPLRRQAIEKLHLSANGLAASRPRRADPLLSISSPQTTGLKAQEWCPYGQGRVAAESAPDQREDDGGSLCFDGAPLAKPLNIVGEARLRVLITADRPQAMVAVRLTDVSPDGTSDRKSVV